MTEPAVVSASIQHASHLATGSWGNDSALSLVFRLSDGRTTQPTYIPGQWQIADFLEMLDVTSIDGLAGTNLRVVLLDPAAQVPTVTEVLFTDVPKAFGRAFGEDD